MKEKLIKNKILIMVIATIGAILLNGTFDTFFTSTLMFIAVVATTYTIVKSVKK